MTGVTSQHSSFAAVSAKTWHPRVSHSSQVCGDSSSDSSLDSLYSGLISG